MDPQLANDYNEVKAMLLREFKLSPAVYLQKFNAETRKSDETCLLYSARLVAILDAYLDSRKVNQSYQKVTEVRDLRSHQVYLTRRMFKTHFGY